MTHALESRDKEVNRRIDTIGWGVVLVIVGLSALAGTTTEWKWFSDHGWMIAVGALFLGINLYRFLIGMPISWFTTLLGAFAVAGGLADLTGTDLPIGPAVLIAIGLALVASVWRRSNPAG
jgi:uncharacterized membrane protein YkgB